MRPLCLMHDMALQRNGGPRKPGKVQTSDDLLILNTLKGAR